MTTTEKSSASERHPMERLILDFEPLAVFLYGHATRGGFFVAMALGNEIVRHTLSFEVWLRYKLWGVMPLTLLFAAAQIPMLLRHGLSDEAKTIAVPEGD